jgi:hypothetical protein
MAISKKTRTFVCLLVLAVFTLPVGPAPLASDTPSCEGSQSEGEAVCETTAGQMDGQLDEQIEDADSGPVCHGILTCTFYVAGHVIALPFRLLGGALKIII